MEKDYSLESAATEFGRIREQDHNATLELVACRLQASLSYRTLTQTERDAFITSGNQDIHPVLGARPWAREHFILGNLGYIATRRGTALGHTSFSVLDNNDAIIVGVQGIKGQNFTPDRRIAVVQAVENFASGIGVNKLLMVTGEIVNLVREEPLPHLERVYSEIARESGFTQEINGIPFKGLN